MPRDRSRSPRVGGHAINTFSLGKCEEMLEQMRTQKETFVSLQSSFRLSDLAEVNLDPRIQGKYSIVCDFLAFGVKIEAPSEHFFFYFDRKGYLVDCKQVQWNQAGFTLHRRGVVVKDKKDKDPANPAQKNLEFVGTSPGGMQIRWMFPKECVGDLETHKAGLYGGFLVKEESEGQAVYKYRPLNKTVKLPARERTEPPAGSQALLAEAGVSISEFFEDSIRDLVQYILSKDSWAKEVPDGAIRVCEVVDLQVSDKTYPGKRLKEHCCMKPVAGTDKRIRTVDDLIKVVGTYKEYISCDKLDKLRIVVPHKQSLKELQDHPRISVKDLGPRPKVLDDDCLHSNLTTLAPAFLVTFSNEEGANTIKLRNSDIPMACFSVGQNSSIFDKYCKLASVGTIGESVVALDHPIRAHVSYMQAMGDFGKNDKVYQLLHKTWGDNTSDVTDEKLKELASQWDVLFKARLELPYMLDLDKQKAEDFKELAVKIGVRGVS